MAHSDHDPSLGHKFEAIFSLFLVALVFLSRDNHHFVVPHVYYFFILLLIVNLAATSSLRFWPMHPWVSTAIVLANCAVVTGILYYSGGAESNLWVLYFLPIFTASVFLNTLQLFLITVGALAFNGAFSLTEGFWDDRAAIFLLGVKSATIAFAAGMTGWISARDRKSRFNLTVQRIQMVDMEDKLKTQELEIARIEKMADMSHISAGAAHDMNNPLTVILGTVRLLLEDPETPEALRMDLERINRSATLCHNISFNLLNMAKAQDLDKSAGSVNDLIESALAIYEPTLKKSNIEVVRQMAHAMPDIWFSVPQMQRVILNLLENARSVMKRGGKLTIITRGISLSSLPALEAIQIIVEDTGPGIPSGFLEKLFKPFNTTKPPQEGTGLGLYVSREIVVRHGGRLQAENREAGGARFIVTLPVGQLQAAAA